MRIEEITDHDAAVAFLRHCHADWIDGMPATTSMPAPGNGSLAQNSHYDPIERRGVIALFLGGGFKKQDAGWRILVAHDATGEEFSSAAFAFAVISVMRLGGHPSDFLR
jgi:hypothetical protein